MLSLHVAEGLILKQHIVHEFVPLDEAVAVGVHLAVSTRDNNKKGGRSPSVVPSVAVGRIESISALRG